jgi:N-methylhydantoinase B
MSPGTKATTDVVWDGVNQSYIPPTPLQIDPAVKLHTEAADEVDGVDYEVLRHALWNVNDEHGVTIEKVSGSPFASNAHDFNTVILTEDGEYVFFGPHIQYFSGAMDMPIKWTLEKLGGRPGISEGDMFLSNDPWVGASHQSDVQLTCPVFWEGRIFCWVANALHQYDIGGNTPGSFCADAETVFDEPVPIPPLKMVEADQIRPDLERMYLRHSRQPQLVALDLRAQMAGNIVARNRIHAFIERYGPRTVKAVMHKIISDGEESFVRRLRQIPDGTWRAVGYLEAALPGDRGVYQVTMNVRKEGNLLTFDNKGSHKAVGAVNSTFSGWRAGIISILNPYLCYDQLYSTGGMLRHLRFEPEVGTINCPSFPASVTNSQIANVFGGALANAALGKMMLSAPELRNEAFAVGGSSVFPLSAIGGIDQWGNEFGTGFLDPLAGAVGAFPSRDGVDTGGSFYEPKTIIGNVEQIEQMFPVLYLYRREQPDSGGAGKFRGGNGGAFAVVAHGVETIFHAPSAAGCAVPTSLGLSGGAPGCTNNFRMLRESDVRARFENGDMPQRIEEFDGHEQLVQPKERGMTQGLDDIWEVRWCAGAGYGDPLERDPQMVLADVVHGRVSRETATAVYGVTFTDRAEGVEVDGDATVRRREEARSGRLERGQTWAELNGGDDAGK